jgi:hypothetical protein
MNGFVVQVGCQQLVFTDIEDVARLLIDYQRHPEAVEKDFIAHQVNKTYGPNISRTCEPASALPQGETAGSRY